MAASGLATAADYRGASSTSSTSSAAQGEVASDDAVLAFDTAEADGFTASVSGGSVTANDDGSVTIVNGQGEEAGRLATKVLLDDGTSRTISYEVSGNSITASYDAPIGADQQPLSLQGDGVECGIALATAGGAYLGAAGAALTAPFTFGGGLVVAGAALGAGAAATNAAYQCYG